MANIHGFKFVIIFFFILLCTNSFAAPPDNSVQGRLVFLGKTHDSSRSVWLSVTTAGSFQLEAQGNQLIDEWSKSARGLHLSLSPIVSQGNGGTHFLINAANNRILDSQNQKGGIIFPPLPSEPPSVMPPIVIPPDPIEPPGIPTHPIVVPPGGVEPPGGTQPPGNNPSNPEVSSPTAGTSDSTSQSSDKQPNQKAPITKGRQFEQETFWNIWSDNRYFDTNDNRNNLDGKGTTTDFSIGADHFVSTNLAMGFLFSLLKYDNTAIDGGIENRTHGFSTGPYFGYRLSPRWSIDGSASYGRLQNNNDIALLNSQYTTQLYHADLKATGLYQFNQFQLRPKPLISFTHFRNPAYQFNGVFLGRAFQVDRPSESFNFNYAEFRLESNYTKVTKKGDIIQPYAEAGIDYAFAQPNDGQVLTGNLALATVSPLTETLTLGVRTLLSKALLIDSSGSYLSFGQGGLSVWELRLLASYSFG